MGRFTAGWLGVLLTKISIGVPPTHLFSCLTLFTILYNGGKVTYPVPPRRISLFHWNKINNTETQHR